MLETLWGTWPLPGAPPQQEVSSSLEQINGLQNQRSQEGLQHYIVDCPETRDCADTLEGDAGRQHLARAVIAPFNSLPLLFGETAHTPSERPPLQIRQSRVSQLLSVRLLLPDVSAAVCCAAGCVPSDGDRSKIGHHFAKTQEDYLSHTSLAVWTQTLETLPHLAFKHLSDLDFANVALRNSSACQHVPLGVVVLIRQDICCRVISRPALFERNASEIKQLPLGWWCMGILCNGPKFEMRYVLCICSQIAQNHMTLAIKFPSPPLSPTRQPGFKHSVNSLIFPCILSCKQVK